jgi:hypothetical protein
MDKGIAMGRKIIIGVAATLITAALFAAYLRLTGNKGISISGGSAVQDVPDRPFDPQAKRIDDTIIHSAEQSRYTILDPRTKRVYRIFGFEKLLNPGSQSNNWQVEKPYINFFEKQFNCRMDAERGIFEVETSGGNPVPQNAQFTGKVAIRLQPTQGQGFKETVILMDDLSYSSERSEFFTNGPVELVSAQARLVGKGLLMIYNPASQQIEYFEIQKLDYLRLKNVVAARLLGQSAETTAIAQKEPDSQDSSFSQGGLPRSNEGELDSSAPQALDQSPNPSQNEPNAAPLYQCTLNDKVRIVYGNQAIIKSADQINIINVIFGGKTDTATKTAEPNQIASAPADNNQPADQTPPAQKEENVEWANRTKLPATPADDDAQDVLVTCRGKLIFRPMSIAPATTAMSVQADANESALAAAQETAAESESSDPAQKLARFEARKIDYNLTQGNAMAAGPVRFSFYTPADANDPGSSVPVVITAQKNAEFFAGDKKSIRQVVFNGNIVGDATEEKPSDKSIRRLYGDKLTVDLAADPNGKTQMAHVAVTDGSVRLEALRFLNDVKTSHVKLNCKRFDYDGALQTIVAAGPGEIQLNNRDISAADPNTQSQSLDFRQPCVALINGFDTLTWLRPENKIRVEGSKESMNLSYMTIKDGKPDKITNAQAMNAVLQIAQDADGRDMLKELTADHGVFMEQVGQHTLKGQKLRFTGDDGWVRIEGDETQPCFVDGVKAPVINYNLQTGQLKTQLSSAPGAVGLPPK